MNKSEWNRKVALSRWSKVQNEEKNNILSDWEGKKLKSAICGFLAGDGSVKLRNMGTYNKYEIDFFPDDKIMLKTYIQYIKKVYNKMPSIRRKGKIFAVRITSRTIVEDLIAHAQFGIKKWKIPFELLSDLEYKKYWLKAFFSAEGYVNNNTIKVQTVNKEGMTQLSNLLNELLINHNLYSYKPKIENYSEVYIIMINQKEARRKFCKDIGFWHSKKMQILKKSLV